MITFVYANRNRDLNRIRLSLDSLQSQKAQNFSVSFVDYGSEPKYLDQLESLLSKYPFVNFYRLNVSHLLWNKSKALNYGILKSTEPYVFTADVDLLFYSDLTSVLQKLANPNNFYLFKLNYLNEKQSESLQNLSALNDCTPFRSSYVNGMILVSREACLKVNGYDEFFHFYGGEDVDFFNRLQNFGLNKKYNSKNLISHKWHKSFLNQEDSKLTLIPRLKNIMRINEQHVKFNARLNLIKPKNQQGMAFLLDEKEFDRLSPPSRKLEISNIKAQVEHFLEVELPAYKGEIVQIIFNEDPYYKSFKYHFKKLIRRQTQIYISLKEVNDMILKAVLYKYRDSNYLFSVAGNLKSIEFRIEL